MQRLGFIHDMMDVKVLILFVTARINYPLDRQELYEVCYQDDCLSYFDICTALPEMLESGHLELVEGEKYQITEKGRETAQLTEDSLVYTVKRRAENAVMRCNNKMRRGGRIKTDVVENENGQVSVIMSLLDDKGKLMTLELPVPDQRQGLRLSRLFENKAESIYNLVMMDLLEDEENSDI